MLIASSLRPARAALTISQTRDNSSTHEAIIAAIDTGQPAVLITSSPSAAVISANRNQNVRAAVGHDFPAVRRAIDEANANLLAIDPRGKSTTQLFGLINEFLTRN